MKKLTIKYTNGKILEEIVNDVQAEGGKLYISHVASCGIAEPGIIHINPKYIKGYSIEDAQTENELRRNEK